MIRYVLVVESPNVSDKWYVLDLIRKGNGREAAFAMREVLNNKTCYHKYDQIDQLNLTQDKPYV